MKKRVPVTYRDIITDDRTDREIVRGGWELRGMRKGAVAVYHFASLTSLACALLDRPEIFGVSKENFKYFMETTRCCNDVCGLAKDTLDQPYFDREGNEATTDEVNA